MTFRNLVLLLVAMASTSSSLTVKERQEFVDIHNYLRRSVVPEAADMQEVKYSIEIEAAVVNFLELCRFEHRAKDNYGENGRLASDANITNTVFSWFQERVYFDILLPSNDPNRCSRNNSEMDYLGEVQCGHYVMMVKSTVKWIGCGYKFCKTITAKTEKLENSFITFCFYDSGAKNPPYESGKRCSSCDSSYKFCYNDLCSNRPYNVTVTPCKLECKNCGTKFGGPNVCLCDCPEGTTGDGCSGKPSTPDPSCSPCKSISETCLNGGLEDVSAEKCRCICKEGFQGSFCEVRKDWQVNSYEHLIDGLPWRYNMTTPANILQFRNSFSEFQNTISQDVSSVCATKNAASTDDLGAKCKELSGRSIPAEGVRLLPGYPSLMKNGTLKIRMFINYSGNTEGSKEERFVSPLIIEDVWKSPSKYLKELIENVRRIYPISLEGTPTTSPPTTTTPDPPTVTNTIQTTSPVATVLGGPTTTTTTTSALSTSTMESMLANRTSINSTESSRSAHSVTPLQVIYLTIFFLTVLEDLSWYLG